MTDELLHAFATIAGERDYQDEKWGTDEHPSVAAFILYMEDHLAKARASATHADVRHDGPRKDVLNAIRKVAALAVACLEEHGAPQRVGYERRWLRCPECCGPCLMPVEAGRPVADKVKSEKASPESSWKFTGLRVGVTDPLEMWFLDTGRPGRYLHIDKELGIMLAGRKLPTGSSLRIMVEDHEPRTKP